MTTTKKPYKRIALSLSMILLMVWAMLGTSASLAWFKDTSNELHNIFHFGDFNIEVSYQTESGDYELVKSDTVIFNDEDLYEPGYVKIQYLKIENKGTKAVNIQTGVNITSCTLGINVYGEEFNLKDYIRYGVIYADDESELDSRLADRDLAKQVAVDPFDDYASEVMSLDAAGTKYMAIILRMPEEVGNEANYQFNVVPTIEFGITVKADQKIN